MCILAGKPQALCSVRHEQEGEQLGLEVAQASNVAQASHVAQASSISKPKKPHSPTGTGEVHPVLCTNHFAALAPVTECTQEHPAQPHLTPLQKLKLLRNKATQQPLSTSSSTPVIEVQHSSATPTHSPSKQRAFHRKLALQRLAKKVLSAQLKSAALGAGFRSRKKSAKRNLSPIKEQAEELEVFSDSAESFDEEDSESNVQQDYSDQSNVQVVIENSFNVVVENNVFVSATKPSDSAEMVTEGDEIEGVVTSEHLSFQEHQSSGIKISINQMKFASAHAMADNKVPPVEGSDTEVVAPKSFKSCRKVGKIRKNVIVPYFNSMQLWSLRPEYFQDLMSAATYYDAINGQTLPDLSAWTDAFTDPFGATAKCPTFWSPLDNAFTHKWKDTNIYGFPSMHDDLVQKTLLYHIVQQKQAQQSGTFFRGMYLVPYKPTAPYWRLASHFQLLKIFRTGTPMFLAPANRGKSGKMQVAVNPVPMCLLYDQG